MLDLPDTRTAHSAGQPTRRQFLKAGTLGAIGLSLPNGLAAHQVATMTERGDARRCIMIFNVGGPSHLDLWDMKPEAPSEIRGPFQPISTVSPEIQLSELLPGHARVADKLALVRSCHHGGPAVHEAGWQLMQTGHLAEGDQPWPHVGSVISCLRGDGSSVPPFVVLPALMGRGGGNLPHGQSAGCLDKRYEPLVFPSLHTRRTVRRSVQTGEDTASQPADTATGFSAAMTDKMIERLDQRWPELLEDPHLHQAYCQLTSRETRQAFNLDLEPPAVRRRYGWNRFGQCCLLARRLVEAGVRLVTINTFLTVFNQISWDVHGMQPFTTMDQMRDVVAPMYDQAVATLVCDLDQRGLLDHTLVCSLAEFGRTPRINPAGGRDHWPQCFTCCFAGAGVQGGRVVGRSDAIGALPADRPVTPGDIVATVLFAMGIDPATLLRRPDGCSRPLVDAASQPIWELF